MLKGYLNCDTIAKLVPLYIDDKLDSFQKDCVAIHLRNCPNCMNQYSIIKKFLKEVKLNHQEKTDSRKLKEDLSAHFDNECSHSEILELEARFCENENATKEFDNIANLSKLMANCFLETKEKIMIDYTKNIMGKVKKRSLYEKIIDRLKS